MKLIIHKARLILCGLILISFFLPAYQSTSGFSFARQALSDFKNGGEITFTDIFVLVAPLLAMQAVTLYILVRSYFRYAVRKTFTALPALFLGFFLVVIYYSYRNIYPFSGKEVLKHLQIGSIIAGLSCALVIFTKDLPRKRRRRRRSSGSVQTLSVAEPVNQG